MNGACHNNGFHVATAPLALPALDFRTHVCALFWNGRKGFQRDSMVAIKLRAVHQPGLEQRLPLPPLAPAGGTVGATGAAVHGEPFHAERVAVPPLALGPNEQSVVFDAGSKMESAGNVSVPRNMFAPAALSVTRIVRMQFPMPSSVALTVALRLVSMGMSTPLQSVTPG